MSAIYSDDLKEGDVLLYHGTAFISKLIITLDGGPYSHASYFHGDHGGISKWD
jgi:hypothetical protein